MQGTEGMIIQKHFIGYRAKGQASRHGSSFGTHKLSSVGAYLFNFIKKGLKIGRPEVLKCMYVYQ